MRLPLFKFKYIPKSISKINYIFSFWRFMFDKWCFSSIQTIRNSLTSDSYLGIFVFILDNKVLHSSLTLLIRHYLGYYPIRFYGDSAISYVSFALVYFSVQ